MKKKVLVFNNRFFELSETFIYLQAKLMVNSFAILLVGYESKNLNHFDTRGMEVHLIETGGSIFWTILYKVVRRLGFNTPYEFLEGRRLRGILTKSNISLVHAHFGYNAVKILPLVKRFKIPLVVSFHGIDASKRIFNQPKYYERLPELLDYASRIIVVSDHMIDNLAISSVNRPKVVLLPYSVDANFFNSPIRSNDKSAIVHILHSGRLVPKKGILDVIRVFKALLDDFREIQLHIIGEGEDYESAKELVDKYEIADNVIFYGSQPHEKVKDVMTMAHIFVLNSRIAENGDMEGTPVSLLEAMSMRKAVVSTYHAGIPHVIHDGYDGLLVTERNNKELCDALKRLVADPDLRFFLGENARKTIEERFNKERLRLELTNVYNSVLEAK